MEPPRVNMGIATKVTLLLCVIVVASSCAVGVTMYWRFSRTLVMQELHELSADARNKSARFVAQIGALRADASFLAQSPVVQGMIRARQAAGIDPKLLETEAEIEQRMAAVFTELLDAKPHYCGARLIGVEDGGREIVRVECLSSGERPGARQSREPSAHIRTVPRTELQQMGQESYFAATLRLGEDEVFLTGLNLNREHGRVPVDRRSATPVLRAAAPVYDGAGKPAAILMIDRFMQPLMDALREGVAEGHTLLLTNDQGEYLVHPDAARTFAFEYGQSARIQQDFPELAGAFVADRQEFAAVIGDSTDTDRIAIGVYKARFDPQDPSRFVAFALMAPYEDVVAESARIGNHSLWISSTLLLGSLAVGYILSRSVTEPLRQIASAAEAFGRGESGVVLPTMARDETGVLARTLAEMMNRVAAAKEELERRAMQLDEARRDALGLLQDVEAARKTAVAAEQVSRDHGARIQAILDSATDAIITIDSDGLVEVFNAAAEQMFGHRAEDVIGYNVNMLMPSPYQEEHDQHIRNYLKTGIKKIIGIRREVVGRRADGSTFPIDISISEVKLGDRRMFTGIICDISDLKRALQQLGEANVELTDRARQIERFNVDLRRSNDELKQFAYVASHDLQEPLRKVTSFCQMLEREYGDRLDGDARQYIQHAVDGASRMRTLVQDLLTYSRVETQGKPLRPIDANDACSAAIDNLAAAIEETEAAVTREALPVVPADRAQLVRLFQNLIGNAIKYRSAEPPRIHVSADEADSEWIFRVRDNGLGIDPQYHARIFVIFQRLHARDEYSGTGIGLAVCKRIVERFGGRIWVESQEGSGSVFSFAIPKSAHERPTSLEGVSANDQNPQRFVAAAG